MSVDNTNPFQVIKICEALSFQTNLQNDFRIRGNEQRRARTMYLYFFIENIAAKILPSKIFIKYKRQIGPSILGLRKIDKCS